MPWLVDAIVVMPWLVDPSLQSFPSLSHGLLPSDCVLSSPLLTSSRVIEDLDPILARAHRHVANYTLPQPYFDVRSHSELLGKMGLFGGGHDSTPSSVQGEHGGCRMCKHLVVEDKAKIDTRLTQELGLSMAVGEHLHDRHGRREKCPGVAAPPL